MTSWACDSCYKRKIKCNAATPRCSGCSYYSVSCTFSRSSNVSRKRSLVKKHRAESRIGERIDRIGNIPHSLFADEGAILSDQHVLRFPWTGLGLISSFNGIPFFSSTGQEWVQSRTGEKASVNHLPESIPPWQNMRSSWPEPSQRHPVELPDLRIVEEYMAIYQASPVYLVFPLVDASLHLETMNIVYHSLQEQCPYGITSRKSGKASLFAFFAFCSAINLGQIPRASVDGEVYAAEARRMLPEVLREKPTLDGLQCLVMLLLYHTISGDIRSVDILIGNAAHMIFKLGANLFRDTNLGLPSENLSDLPSRAHCHLRNLFWICYAIDKELFLRIGRCPSLNDDDCDLTLPPGYIDPTWADHMAAQPSARPVAEPLLFPTDLKLSILVSKIYRTLYSASALRSSVSEILRTIRERDEELKKWSECLLEPDRFIALLSNDKQSEPVTKVRSIMLRIQYHHCVAAIHQASHRCTARTGDSIELSEGIRSSQELSIEASRSLLLFLRATKNALPAEYFWFVLFYPMWALSAIFCNLLYNPQATRKTEDLKLLSDATMCLRSGLDVGSSPDTSRVRAAIHFMAELNWLASCAIFKADTGHS